jgi:hypothetical protein
VRHRPRPLASSVSYSDATDEIHLRLDGGITLVIPRRLIDELRDARADHMRDLTLIGDGEGLASEADDVHIFVPGLVRDLIGEYDLRCFADDPPVGEI